MIGWAVFVEGLVTCEVGAWGDLGLYQMWRDPGLRPVAGTRTKTGLTGEAAVLHP